MIRICSPAESSRKKARSMCGISGCAHFRRRTNSCLTLSRVNSKLRHRGPDQHGNFESRNAAMSAVRLKIIDLEGGDQPMQSKDGDCVLAFNGEIFNHVELRRELEGLGHRFQSQCDTEVALRAFMQWDTDCFRRFRGMFAMAFWRESRRRLVLARDRLGIKPLYYVVWDGKLYFGSELKAIFEFSEIPRRLSQRALSYFLALNYVPTPWTLVEGIEKLGPGFWLEYTPNGELKEQYWRNRFSPQATDMEEACEELDLLLRSAVSEHLASDVPVEIWTSGGLDSATTLHYCAENSPLPPETFSISFPGKQFDESRYACLLRERYRTRHHELNLSADLDLTSAIHDIAYYSDEPSADAGALPVWFLSRMTTQHLTVALSGEGADELFGGYQTCLADRYAAGVKQSACASKAAQIRPRSGAKTL